ncbi:MAG: TonB-dependent receptor [Algibacter sp.]
MKIFILLFSLSVFSFSPITGFSQNTKIKIKDNQVVSVDQVFKLIKNQTDFRFIYRANLFDNYPKVTLKKGVIRTDKLLDLTLSKGGFVYEFALENTIVIKNKIVEKSAVSKVNNVSQKIVIGNVTDENGLPLPGVTVQLKNAITGVLTDFDGNFKINLKGNSENSVLIFSYLGYKKIEMTIGTKLFIKVKMIPNIDDLDEVIVIGYGTSTVKDATGSVARITSKDIDRAPMQASVEGMLQGKAAGVSVQINSASPTSNTSVIIRGASSLSGDNQPLWVIDGVPQYDVSTSGNVDNTLKNLNLDDVQSVDILKDASATAVYGSRAANGVVIVTTKRGKIGTKPQIEISSRAGLTVMDFNDYQLFNTDEYKAFFTAVSKEAVISEGNLGFYQKTFLDEAVFNALNTSEYDASDLKLLPDAFYDSETSWQNDMTQNPIAIQTNFSIRGGSDNNTYYISLNYSTRDGVVKSGSSDTYGGRLNFTSKISETLKFGLNMNASTRTTNSKDGMLDVIKLTRPDLPPFNEDGSIYTHDIYTENPLTTLLNTNKGENIMFSGTSYLDYEIIKNLNLKGAYTVNFSDFRLLRFNRDGSSDANSFNNRTWSDTRRVFQVFDATLKYDKTINKKHRINLLAGYSTESSTRGLFYMKAQEFPDNDVLINFGSAAQLIDMDETETSNALVSQFARAHYKFDNRYIISGTIRRDGSSRFGEDQRFGIFPSGALAWTITEESFMKSPNIKKYISYLKLRASLGVTGSQNLGNFNWLSLVAPSIYDDSPAISPSTIANPNLQWEETQMFDLGLDYSFFDSRVKGSVGIYEKQSNDLIYESPLALSTSYKEIDANVASISNKGFEFDIKYYVLRNSNHQLSLNFNYSTNVTKVTNINSTTDEILYPSVRYPYIRLVEGGETGQWFGLQTAGRFYTTAEDTYAYSDNIISSGQRTHYNTSSETAGDLIFIDQDGDGKITDDDRTNIGSSTPKGFGGFSFSYQYKNFSINSTFSYAYGHKRFWSMAYWDIVNPRNYNQSNLIAGSSTIVESPFEADYPRVGIGSNSKFSDFYLHDASYIRLNALNLSYKLPSEAFKNSPLKSIELTLQATNLLTITKYPGFDPQGNWTSSRIGSGMSTDSSRYPSSQVYSLGIRINIH